MRKGRIMGKIFGIALVFAMIAAMVALGGFASQGQILAQEARTWHVDDDLADYPDADFTKIQDAVDAAAAGDTIIVYPGTYTENINVNKSLTIESESGAETTIVQAADPNDSVFEVMADYVGISGFTVDGASKGEMDGAYLSGGSGIALNSGTGCNISNNIFGNNNLFGIYIHPDSQGNHILENTFEGCGIFLDLPPIEHLASHTIEGNSVNGKPIYYYKDTEGITVPDNAGQVIIVNCSDMVVKNINASSASVGIELVNTNNSTVENNDCSDNMFGALMYFSSGSTLSNNTVSNSQYALLTRYDNNIRIEGNAIHHLSYKGFEPEVVGLAVMDSEDVEVENNTIYHLIGNDTDCSGIVAGVNSERIRISGNEVSNIHSLTSAVGILAFGNTSDILIASNSVYGTGDNGITVYGKDASMEDIVVENNTVHDCYWQGVLVYYAQNVTVKDNELYHNTHHGVGVEHSSLISVTGNEIYGNGQMGIHLGTSLDNMITNNTVFDNTFGIALDNASNNEVVNNIAHDNNAGIRLSDSSNHNVIMGNTANSNTVNHGIWLWESCNNTVTNNTANENNEGGICLDYSSNNIITNNTANENNHCGIQLFQESYNNTVIDNTANSNNEGGICLESSSNNTLTSNMLNSNEGDGVHLWDSGSTIIGNNTVSNNAAHGICLVDSSDNQIYHNNLIDNTQNASDDTGTNSWDDGSKGNYWSDYEERYPDAGEVDGTGIWDTPYEIPGEAGATDHYPLMEPYLTNNPPVAVGLDSIKGWLVMAYGYKAGEGVGGWTVYNPEWAMTHPDWNSLTTLYVQRGYWINVSGVCDLTYGAKTYQLDASWNLIGWLGW